MADAAICQIRLVPGEVRWPTYQDRDPATGSTLLYLLIVFVLSHILDRFFSHEPGLLRKIDASFPTKGLLPSKVLDIYFISVLRTTPLASANGARSALHIERESIGFGKGRRRCSAASERELPSAYFGFFV